MTDKKLQVTQETLDKAMAGYQWYVACPMWELNTGNVEKQLAQFIFNNRIEAIYDENKEEMVEEEYFEEITYDGVKLYVLDFDANKWEVVCEVL